MITFGPVLGFRGATTAGWTVGVLVRDDVGPATLEYRRSGGPWTAAPAVPIGDEWLADAYRYDITVALGAAVQAIEYRLIEAGGRNLGPWIFTVPSSTEAPRIAYASCNGFASPKDFKAVRGEKNERWIHLNQLHGAHAYNLLIMGGDQVYADEMWDTVRLLKEWNNLDWDAGNKRAFTGPMRDATRKFYADLYPRRWGQPEIARVLAQIPTLMMWDDHDVFDGWGSYPNERLDCGVFQGIFSEAREAFRIYQRQLSRAEWAGGSAGGIAGQHGFSFGHLAGGMGILGIDMRSERTENRVLSPGHWDAVFTWLDAQTSLNHLLVLSSIPVVYPSISAIERIVGVLPGRSSIEDDLRDQWSSRAHAGERIRLVHRLLQFAHQKGTRVTLLSGDVHVAALGVITSTRGGTTSNAAIINQLTSSAIVHPAPPGIVLFGLEHLMEKTFDIDREITAELQPFPGTERRYIGARNWLAIEPDPGAAPPRLWANWHVEGETLPYTKVIHPA